MNLSAAAVLHPSQPTRDRSFLIIVSFVMLMHGVIFIWALRDSTEQNAAFKPKERLIVKTISLSPSRPAAKFIEPEPEIEPSPVIADITPPPVQEIAAAPEPEPVPEHQEEPVSVEPEVSNPEISQPQEKEAAPIQPKVKAKKQEASPKAKNSKPNKQPEKPKNKAQPKKNATPPPVKNNAKPKAAPNAKIQNEPPKPAPPKNNAREEAFKAKQRQLMAKAQESIGKIQSQKAKISSAKNTSSMLASTPGPLTGLHIDALPADAGTTLSGEEISYRDELAGRLKLLLRLPEYGEVKIRLTLERSGKVSKVAIVSAESNANRKYIEKTVPALQFPGFGRNFGSEPQYTFVITLSNDF